MMEFVGETLESHVDGWEYPAPWSAVAPLALDLVSAVEWLYFHHVVHLGASDGAMGWRVCGELPRAAISW